MFSATVRTWPLNFFWKRGLARVMWPPKIHLAEIHVCTLTSTFWLVTCECNWDSYTFMPLTHVGTSFSQWIDSSCILHKFLEELAWTCIKIWCKKKNLFLGTSFLSMCQGHHTSVLTLLSSVGLEEVKSSRIALILLTFFSPFLYFVLSNRWVPVSIMTGKTKMSTLCYDMSFKHSGYLHHWGT